MGKLQELGAPLLWLFFAFLVLAAVYRSSAYSLVALLIGGLLFLLADMKIKYLFGSWKNFFESMRDRE